MTLLIVKSGIRAARRRRLEGLSLAVIVWISVSLLGIAYTIVANMETHVSMQIRDRIGDVMIFGVFPEESIRGLEGIEGVVSVRAYKVMPTASLEVKGREYLVSVVSSSYMERVKVKNVEGRLPGSGDEAAIYWALSGPQLRGLKESIGSKATLRLYTLQGEPLALELEVVGVSWGYEWVGGRRIAVVVDDRLMDEVTGGRYTAVALLLDNPSSRDLNETAREASRLLEAGGGRVAGYLTMKPEENPIVVLIKGALSIVTVPSTALLALILVLPAAAGSAMVVRESRVVALLKAEGGGIREVLALVITPWVAWGLIGVVLGVVTVALASEPVYSRLFVGDAEIARLLYQAYGFRVPLEVLARIALLGLAGVLVGALAPLTLALKVDVVRSLRSAELPVQMVPPRFRAPLPLNVVSAFRDALGRPWKILGLALALAVVWGIAGGMTALAVGVDDIVVLYSERMPPDAFIVVESLTFNPPVKASAALEEAIKSVDEGRVRGYTIISSVEAANALGLNEFFSIVAYTGGDPSIAFPLYTGRYPEGPGEAVVSKALATMLGLSVGDRLSLEVRDERVELKVVGISYSRLANGFYALVTPEYFKEIIGVEPGVLSATAHIDLADGADPEEFLSDLGDAVEAMGFLAPSESVTREELVDAISTLSGVLYAIMGGILVFASVGAAIGVAAIIAVDSSSRAREHAVLLAVGAPRRWILAAYATEIILALALSSIPAYLIASYIAGVVAERSALAVGYITPRLEPQVVLAPGNMLTAFIVGITAGLVAAYIYLGRLRLVEILRE